MSFPRRCLGAVLLCLPLAWTISVKADFAGTQHAAVVVEEMRSAASAILDRGQWSYRH